VTLNRRAAELRQHFEAAFAMPPTALVRAPGRVNLIGEHTDYNDGFVLPAAIERDVVMAAAASGDSMLQVFTTDFNRRAAFDLEHLEPKVEEPWANYIAGVAWALREAGHPVSGARLALQSSIPHGSGLSSSAALELAAALAFQTLLGLDIARPVLAKLCQRAENEFVGMPCGIMDQFIAALGRDRHALLLDCRSLDYEYVPVSAGSLVIAHSGVRRELVGSEYRDRRAQCESAAAKLASVLPGIRALRDVSSADLQRHGHLLSPVELRRARHVVGEDERTIGAARTLKDGDLEAFGRLMVASHNSLRDDYEVSCPELDLLVELALAIPGVYGSRMTGGGFGGCTITLARPDGASAVREGLAHRYRERTGIEPLVFVSGAAAGANKLAS
jgi:galactokinase